ncbi:MAG TPA: hypothetical protein VGD50_04065 [Candidatus Baltobacteraceae bacterium]
MMNHLMSAAIAAALLATPALARADQQPTNAQVAQAQYRVIDGAGNVVGALFTTGTVALNLRTIGHVAAEAPQIQAPEESAPQPTRLLTPLDFVTAWNAELEPITRSYPGGEY